MKLSCEILLNNSNDVVYGLAQAAGLFYNGTNGALDCFDIFGLKNEKVSQLVTDFFYLNLNIKKKANLLNVLTQQVILKGCSHSGTVFF